MTMAGPLVCFTLRLGPGVEIQSALQKFVREKGLQAPFVVTCVGSVSAAKLRLAKAIADKPGAGGHEIIDLDQRYEIVSLVGTLNDGTHLHVSLADKNGAVIGGHVMNLTVFTTAEIVIGESCRETYSRVMEDSTGHPQLVVNKRLSQKL
ncbi:Hypp2476 [Branchiostoma lanceolatum]|uniref:Hypp2476 protein n=1 Tax=Branchiostoma lanceolatum TaxID=7740 RepID=A0A8K0EPX0_BRALA|nr:Hypp2476 [Branchiostoma lanceolatum]